MKNFGSEFGSKLSDVNRTLSSDHVNHNFCFVTDTCHMLKLADTASVDIQVIVNDNGKLIKNGVTLKASR